MTAKEIKYKSADRATAYGRNGTMRQHGLHMWPQSTGVVELCPITSKGELSNAAKLQIPVEDIDAVVDALWHMQNQLGRMDHAK